MTGFRHSIEHLEAAVSDVTEEVLNIITVDAFCPTAAFSPTVNAITDHND